MLLLQSRHPNFEPIEFRAKKELLAPVHIDTAIYQHRWPLYAFVFWTITMDDPTRTFMKFMTSLHSIRIPYSGKIWRGLSFGGLANRQNIAKFKFSPNLNPTQCVPYIQSYIHARARRLALDPIFHALYSSVKTVLVEVDHVGWSLYLKNSAQAADIFWGTWPTTALLRITATA